MPDKVTGDLLAGNLVIIEGLVGEAREVLDLFAEAKVDPARVKKLSIQARRDLSIARDLLDKILAELARNASPSN
jgi:hypothetical protein